MPSTSSESLAPRCPRCRLRHLTGLPCWHNVAPAITAAVLETYGDACHLCGRLGATTADHLRPRSRGGTDDLDGLRPAHGLCNQRRGAMPLDQWRELYPITPPTYTPSRDW